MYASPLAGAASRTPRTEILTSIVQGSTARLGNTDTDLFALSLAVAMVWAWSAGARSLADAAELLDRLENLPAAAAGTAG